MKTHKPIHFTLIELLVVIAIIAVLAALLLPALNRAVNKSHVTICNSNLKNLGNAANMYGNDNNGVFPINDSVGATRTSWEMKYHFYLASYLGGPSKDQILERDASDWSWIPPVLYCPDRYYTDDRGVYGVMTRANRTTFTLAAYKKPAEIRTSSTNSPKAPLSSTVIASESHHQTQIANLNIIEPKTGYSYYVITRHRGTANFLFLDGHCANRTPRQFFQNPNILIGGVTDYYGLYFSATQIERYFLKVGTAALSSI